MWHAGVAGTNLIVCMSVYNKFTVEENTSCVLLYTPTAIFVAFLGVWLWHFWPALNYSTIK